MQADASLPGLTYSFLAAQILCEVFHSPRGVEQFRSFRHCRCQRSKLSMHRCRCILKRTDTYVHTYIHIYIYIYICSPPPRHAKMHNLPIYPEQLLGNDCENPKIQKSQNPTIPQSKNPTIQKSKKPKIQQSKNPKNQKSKKPKIQKSKNPKIIARFRRCKSFGLLDFWIFGFLEF